MHHSVKYTGDKITVSKLNIKECFDKKNPKYYNGNDRIFSDLLYPYLVTTFNTFQ